jgi:DNA primase
MVGPWLNFAHIRAHAEFRTILAHYGITLKQNHGQVLVRCPFHNDRRPSLSVNLEDKLFNCFACQAKGDVFDIVATIENLSLPEAAVLIAAHCGISLDGQLSSKDGSTKTGQVDPRRSNRRGEVPVDAATVVSSHCPDLDPTHRYLFDRGLTTELIKTFGLGYCKKGRLGGRVCIPIHSADGARILAYAGRWAHDEVPDRTPRYLLPQGFKKSEVLFNYHRVRQSQHLVIVEGYWSVFRLHALHIPALALMGTSLSDQQLKLLCKSRARQITLLLDADEVGSKSTLDLLPRLSSLFFVRAPSLPIGASPDKVSQDQLIEAVKS